MWMALLAPCPRVEFVATDAEADLLDAYREAALRYATRSGLDGVGADLGLGKDYSEFHVNLLSAGALSIFYLQE